MCNGNNGQKVYLLITQQHSTVYFLLTRPVSCLFIAASKHKRYKSVLSDRINLSTCYLNCLSSDSKFPPLNPFHCLINLSSLAGPELRSRERFFLSNLLSLLGPQSWPSLYHLPPLTCCCCRCCCYPLLEYMIGNNNNDSKWELGRDSNSSWVSEL